jgi:hypothetical protein
MAATVRRIITLIVCALCSIQRAGAGSCSVPCTKPAATGPCFFREDVCPYPDGAKLIVGYGKLRSARSRAMPRSFCISHLSWPAGCSAADAIAVKYDSECVSRFKGLMCSLLFPVCRQGVVSPVCWSSCTDAYEVPPYLACAPVDADPQTIYAGVRTQPQRGHCDMHQVHEDAASGTR